jgi:D-serine deaminase-like pyridoxal phosphate-dependent protein
MMVRPTRRSLLIGGAVAAGGGVLLSRTADKSGARDPYFLKMQQALRDAKIAQPTLVVDQQRLDANIDRVMATLPKGMGYRIVAKSLPSLDLLKYVRARAGTDRVMTFNLPMLLALAQAMPEANQLIGKPLPAQAVKNFFAALPRDRVQAAANIQWLVDTPKRLAEYKEIAAATGVTMPIAVELDVGLHRGGVTAGDALNTMLRSFQGSQVLRFAGFMGYEPHLAKLPTIFGWREGAIQKAWAAYAAALKSGHAVLGDASMKSITRNAAGSPTFRLYQDTSVANDIAVGSALVKPMDFDTDMLSDFVPASFIATPVIKASADTHIPGLEFADGMRHFFDANLAKTVFIYGGHWLANPVDPPGLDYNKNFGRSSNQEMLNGGEAIGLVPDDFVFLRPTQSEAVFLQFGDIAVYRDGAITEHWPVFPSAA